MIPELVANLRHGEFALTQPGTLVTFVCHANAQSPTDKPGDTDRCITTRGIQQAKFIGHKLQEVCEGATKIRSTHMRVIDTIHYADMNPWDFKVVPEVSGPNPGTDECRIIEAAQIWQTQIGLSRILDLQDLRDAMEVAAATFLEILQIYLRQNPRVVIVGLPWFNPFFAFHLAGNENFVARRHLLDYPMGECAMYQVGIDDQGQHIWQYFPSPAV